MLSYELSLDCSLIEQFWLERPQDSSPNFCPKQGGLLGACFIGVPNVAKAGVCIALVTSQHFKSLLFSSDTEWRGGNQVGNKYAKKIFPSSEYCYVLWCVCKEESCRPRWSALGKCFVLCSLHVQLLSLELQCTCLRPCLGGMLKSSFWGVIKKKHPSSFTHRITESQGLGGTSRDWIQPPC